MNDTLHPQVVKLLEIPQYEQRSKEWFDQRANKLTSSDVDTVLGNNKYSKYNDVLFSKCGISQPFTGNEATRHGQKYETEAIKLYCELYEKKTKSFGLLPHPTVPWLGGSPDDITYDGIVIEVKCPLRRKIIHGEIPIQYISQVKMNMEITGLDKAVFIEYKPADEQSSYILNVVEIDRDPEWFGSVYPVLEKFWNSVLYYRTHGIDKHEDYKYYYSRSIPKRIIDCYENQKSMFIDEECE